MLSIILSTKFEISKIMGRFPLAHIPIAHIYSHLPKDFPLNHQSENFILN